LPQPDTDESLLAEGYVTVTPLQFNLTHLTLVQAMSRWKWSL
jgi:hypothetical protein